MKNKKRKSLILTGLLFLGIGFATVSTTLYVNGTAGVSTDKSEFDVIFTDCSEGGEISEDGKTITYKGGTLSTTGDEDTLNFTMENKSNLYDADVSISCEFDNSGFGTTITLDNTEMIDNNTVTINSKESIDGSIKLKLLKPATQDADFDYRCTLDATALEKTE